MAVERATSSPLKGGIEVIPRVHGSLTMRHVRGILSSH